MKLTIWFAVASLATGPAFAQEQGGDDQRQDEAQQETTEEAEGEQLGAATETVVTDAHREVWTLMARAAARAGALTEDQTDELIEIYIESRSRFADAEDATRDEWREEKRQELEEQRAEGEVTGEIFDTTELEKTVDILLNRERQKFAQALTELMERSVAETVYPLLGGFDKRTDGIVKEIIGFELADDVELSASTIVQQYYVDTVRARMQPVEQIGPAIHTARQRLINDLTAILSREQVQKLARKAGIPLNS
jgi:hypothetical protein